MDKGWAPILRRIKSSSWYPNPDYVAVYTHLALSVRHEPMNTHFGGELITILPGQLLTTRKLLSLQTGVHESNIERALGVLEAEHLIEQQTSSKNRLITIIYGPHVNFFGQQIEPTADSKRTASEQRPDTHNKILRKKENYTTNDPDFQDFWKGYGLGFDQAGALRAYALLRKGGVQHAEIMSAVERYNKHLWFKHNVEHFPQGKMYARKFLADERWKEYLTVEAPIEVGARNLSREKEIELYRPMYKAMVKEYMEKHGIKDEDDLPPSLPEFYVFVEDIRKKEGKPILYAWARR